MKYHVRDFPCAPGKYWEASFRKAFYGTTCDGKPYKENPWA